MNVHVPGVSSEDPTPLPNVVVAAEWQIATDALLVKERQLGLARDALAAERRRLPMVAVDKHYAFEGPDGQVSLLDLFDGRRQLTLQRFFFEPGVDEYFGLNVFLRHGDRVFRTYFLDGPGTAGAGSIWSLLDLTPFGRQETSEDLPRGWPQTEPGWFRRHGEYSAVSR